MLTPSRHLSAGFYRISHLLVSLLPLSCPALESLTVPSPRGTTGPTDVQGLRCQSTTPGGHWVNLNWDSTRRGSAVRKFPMSSHSLVSSNRQIFIVTLTFLCLQSWAGMSRAPVRRGSAWDFGGNYVRERKESASLCGIPTPPELTPVSPCNAPVRRLQLHPVPLSLISDKISNAVFVAWKIFLCI